MRSNDFLHERYSQRKKLYTKKILGELEAFVECPLDEWGDTEFDNAFDMLHSLDQETQAAYDQFEAPTPTPVSTKKCILCGKETHGSVGKAGIKWSMICQPCKDKEDTALEHRMDGWGREIKKLVNGIDSFAKWLEVEDANGC